MYLTTSPATLSAPEPSAFPFLFPAGAISNGFGIVDDDPSKDPEKELQNWSSLIGIVTAIVGNVLIALALNVQRYAHIQLHRQRAQVRERAKQAMKNAINRSGQNGSSSGGGYGTVDAEPNGARAHTNGSPQGNSDGDGDEAHESDPLANSFQSGDSRWSEDCGDDAKVASTYLKSPSWWLGQVLITVGEMGNFLAYGFAPASIVSPLGVVALISNCVIAPFLFKEVFRPRDFWGVIVSIAGAVTVVLSAKLEETKLDPHDVWDAITTMEFEVYLGVTCLLIVLLMWASPKYGNRTILIDLGLVGLFGGYTVLATKGVSSMLSSTLFGAFTTPVTYALVLVLLLTAVMQVRYVNKALQRFDSTQVIPIQFVLFTLSAIIGSAVLYRDFERTTAEQAIKFVGGCLLTFFGVFLITSGRPRQDDEEDTLSDVDGVEETIGLAEQDPAPGTAQTGLQPARRDSEAARSRRSSRASRVSFLDTVNKPLIGFSDTGIPSSRAPRRSFGGDGTEGSPTLDNAWRESQRRESLSAQPPHPGMAPHAVSSDSVLTMGSAAEAPTALLAEAPTPPPTASVQLPVETPATPRAQPPSTPRPHSHHFSGPLYSPSPLSSTVSAYVADSLLRHVDSPLSRKVAPRRSRRSLRNSLFVRQDEIDAEEYEEAEAALASASRTARSEFGSPDGPLEGQRLLGVSREEDKKGLRTRARSLSNTIGELLGVKRKKKVATTDRDDEPVERRRSGTGGAPGASDPRGSTSSEAPSDSGP